MASRWRGLRDALHSTPLLGSLIRASRNYVLHQSANQAGSVAFSWLLSMFPLLLLLSAGAAFIGRPGDAAGLVGRIVSYAPPLVRDQLRPVIEQVLGQRNQALLALGLFVTVWTASSGMQAIRTALNRAYGIEHGLSFWKARLKVTLLTVVVGAGMLVAFGSVVVMPPLWALLVRNAPDHETLLWLRGGVRHGAAFVFLFVLYAVLYAWLPDAARRSRAVLPGAAVGALLWVAAAVLLSYTLRGAGKLLLVYGSLAGVVATLVFLYACASTLIFGAELNGVMTRNAHELTGDPWARSGRSRRSCRPRRAGRRRLQRRARPAARRPGRRRHPRIRRRSPGAGGISRPRMKRRPIGAARAGASGRAGSVRAQ